MPILSRLVKRMNSLGAPPLEGAGHPDCSSAVVSEWLVMVEQFCSPSPTPGRSGAPALIESSGTPARAVTLLVVLLVATAAFAFGWPTRHGAFLSGDDQRFVVEQVFVNHPSLEHAWKLLTTVHGDLYQPLPMLTFQANYALAAAEPTARFGISPYVFHLTNIFLHTVNAALACLVALGITKCRGTALLAGLMFACHPLALEPVAWISGRMILLATTFSLLLILICITRRKDGRGWWHLSGTFSWLLALMSKVLPTVPIAAAWCDHGRQGKLARRCWVTYAFLLVMGCAATWLAVSLTDRFGMIASTGAESTTSAPVRILLASRYAFENYVWPTRMAAWSPPPEHVPFLSSDTAIAVLEWAVFGVLAWLAWRRNRYSFVGIGLFLILIAPFLGTTLARRLLIADRYMYLPMIGLHLAVAAALAQFAEGLGRRIRPSVAMGLVALPSLVGLAAWMTVSWRYADCWLDTVSRDRRVVEVYPDQVEARTELAKAHIFQNEPDAALRVVAEARERRLDSPRLASEAGEAHRLKKDWQHAMLELSDAAKQMPHRARTQYYYGLTLEQLGNIDEARACYQRILEHHARFLPAATALARSYRSTGELDAAIGMFNRAIEINPYHRDSLFELALLRIQRKHWLRATLALQSIIEVDPNDAQALLNLGVATAQLGRTAEALAIYERLLTLDPTVLTVWINRAGVLVSMGRVNEAESEYRRILSAYPGHRNATIGLHELLQQQQRFGELVNLWVNDQTAGKDVAESRAWLTWAYVLAGNGDEARDIINEIPSSAPERAFADWALAYDALQKGDFDFFCSLLGPPRRPEAVSATRTEEARVILTALSSLPPDLRKSPAGHYALARAFLFQGNAAAARMTALHTLGMPDAAAWANAARELADVLEAAEWEDGR